jgi:2-hydroxy-3-oxopropionate reductase
MINKIGFIGLGIMGKPMAKNLLKVGYHLVIHDLVKEPVKELISLGAEESLSPSSMATDVKTIITMLPDGPDVKEVITGRNGILETATPGSIVIDMSSVAPGISKEIYDVCKQKSVRFMDAPVSGGEPKAIDGTLAIMVGCDQEDFESQLPLLKTMGSSVIRIGEPGSGNVAKLANQIIVALNIAALSEAYIMVKKAGLNPRVVFDAIKGGLAGSTVMNVKSTMMFDRNFKPGFKLKLHIKDLINALETSHKIGAPLPLTAAILELMQTLKIHGKGENDHSVLIEFYEIISTVSI